MWRIMYMPCHAPYHMTYRMPYHVACRVRYHVACRVRYHVACRVRYHVACRMPYHVPCRVRYHVPCRVRYHVPWHVACASTFPRGMSRIPDAPGLPFQCVVPYHLFSLTLPERDVLADPNRSFSAVEEAISSERYLPAHYPLPTTYCLLTGAFLPGREYRR